MSFLKFAAVVLTAVVGLNIVLLDYQKDKVKGFFTFYKPERVCFNYQKSALKDPESAYLYSFDAAGLPETITITAKAKNSYGAYVDMTAECVLLRSGEIDEMEMVLRKLKAFNGH